MIPFQVHFAAGLPVGDQVIHAAKKAILAGALAPGEAFPSVRVLARAVKIHANTAQKVIATLTAEGLLEVRPGIGTVVARRAALPRRERVKLLRPQAEALAVEAARVGMDLGELIETVSAAWQAAGQRVEV